MHDRVERVVRTPYTPNAVKQRSDLIADFRASSAAFALLNSQESIGSGGDDGNRIRQSPLDLADIRLHRRLIARSLIRSCMRPSTRRALLRFRRIISLRRTHGVASNKAVLW
jgi:hypothetical protein